MELASRDVVSRSEQTEIDEGRGIDGNVLLDLRHLGRDYIEKRLGYLQEVSLEFLGISTLSFGPTTADVAFENNIGSLGTGIPVSAA